MTLAVDVAEALLAALALKDGRQPSASPLSRTTVHSVRKCFMEIRSENGK